MLVYIFDAPPPKNKVVLPTPPPPSCIDVGTILLQQAGDF